MSTRQALDDVVRYAATVLMWRWNVAAMTAVEALHEVAATCQVDVEDLAALVAIAPATAP